MKLAPIFCAMLPALTVFASQAEVYQVVELGPVAGYKSSFIAGINNNNQTVGTATGMFNFPVDLAKVDFTNAIFTSNLTAAEIEEIKKGNVNNLALTVLMSYLQANSDTFSVQRITDAFAMRFDTKQKVALRELKAVPTNYEYLLDIDDQGTMLGYATAPFSLQSFTPAATTTVPNPVAKQLWVPESAYATGVLISDKGRQLLTPPYTELAGGFSVPKAISNTGFIVGIGSTGMDATVLAAIKTACNGATEPVALCYYRSVTNTVSYQSDALIWQLDANGVPGVARKLGFIGDKNTGAAHTRTDYPATAYSSNPVDINNAGIAVGTSVYSNSDDIRYTSYGDQVFATSQAAIFNGNEVLMITDPKVWELSSAFAINNKNIVVGYASEKTYTTPDFFVYDYNSQKLTFPATLSGDALTVPAAINDNNLVVGKTQAYVDTTAEKRDVGFLYDMNTATFSNLNRLLPCNSAVNIISATDINDKNVITAIATRKVDKRDLKGDVVKDAAGNPIQEEVAIAVQLNPVANGQVDDCKTAAEEDYERKGATFSFGMLALLMLPWLRRRRS